MSSISLAYARAGIERRATGLGPGYDGTPMRDGIEVRSACVCASGAAVFRRGLTDLADGSGVAATLGCRDHRVCGDVLGRGAVARFPVDYVPELGARNMKKNELQLIPGLRHAANWILVPGKKV